MKVFLRVISVLIGAYCLSGVFAVFGHIAAGRFVDAATTALIVVLFACLAAFLWKKAANSAAKPAPSITPEERQELARKKAEIKAQEKIVYQKQRERQGIHVSFQQLNEFEDNGILPTLDAGELPIMLKAGEKAVYACDASLKETKNKAVGRTGSGGGASFRVAKGVSIQTGGSSSRTVYADVTTSFQGKLFITTERIIFSGNNKSLEIKIPAISAVVADNMTVQIQSGSKPYIFAVPIPAHIKTIINQLYK